MRKTQIVELTKEAYPAWDQLVEDSPQGTIFHRSVWLNTCGRLLGQDVRIFGCFQNDKLVGGCSFFVRNIFGLLRIASSICPMTPYGGVVLSIDKSGPDQENSSMEIMKLVCQAMIAYEYDCTKLVNSPGLVDIRAFTWNGWNSGVRYAYCLDTGSDFQTWVSPKAMSNIRRAMRAGIVVRQSNNISEYCRLFALTFQRQGIKPPVSESFLAQMFDLLRQQRSGEMWIAETASGDIASAEILVWDHKRAYAWSAASDTELRKTGAPSLLLYQEFEELKRRGVKEYNLMSANFPRLASFNSSFNPRLVPYYEVEKHNLRFSIARKIAVFLGTSD
jgi:hypothetical protein